MSDPEIIGEAVAETIEHAIENANEDAARAAEMNALLTEAALEGERGRRIDNLERSFEEWQRNQSDTSEAIAALVLGMTELSAKVELLALQSTPAPQPTSSLPSEKVDGPPESLEPVVVETAEVVETPAPAPAPAPKKKKRNWI